MNTLTGHIHLDFRSQEPIYLQIVRQVEKLVREGVLAPGDQLPTVRQLAIDLRINFSTVARAYHILDETRLISTQRGRGTYIWKNGENNTQSTTSNQTSYAVETVTRLARSFITEAQHLGLSSFEIEQVFRQELKAVLDK